MEDDLRRGLLNKKGGFDKMYQDALLKVAKVRQQNDAFQKHMGPDIDEQLRQEVNHQNRQLEKEISQLKVVLNQMEDKYRDPQSKNKIKQLKADAQKQIQRNKIILKDIIRQSFERRSFGKQNEEDGNRLMQGGAIDYNHLNGNSNQKPPKKESVITDQHQQPEQQVQIDYEIQRKMMLQRNDMMNQVEQQTQKINEIISQQGIMVEQQGQNLDVISDQLMNTNKNLMQANDNLDEAAHHQKKSKKKYICLVIMIIIILIIVAGVIFILTSN